MRACPRRAVIKTRVQSITTIGHHWGSPAWSRDFVDHRPTEASSAVAGHHGTIFVSGFVSGCHHCSTGTSPIVANQAYVHAIGVYPGGLGAFALHQTHLKFLVAGFVRIRMLGRAANGNLVCCQIMILGLLVIPAEAGIQRHWVPACGGTTVNSFLPLALREFSRIPLRRSPTTARHTEC
jgi:hypothetical protein